MLSSEYLYSVIDHVRATPFGSREDVSLELDQIRQRIDQTLAKVMRSLEATDEKKSRRFDLLWTYIEKFVDLNDAVRRRKLANQIYQDLAHERISHERAVIELKALSKRHKGGALAQKVPSLKPVMAWFK